MVSVAFPWRCRLDENMRCPPKFGLDELQCLRCIFLLIVLSASVRPAVNGVHKSETVFSHLDVSWSCALVMWFGHVIWWCVRYHEICCGDRSRLKVCPECVQISNGRTISDRSRVWSSKHDRDVLTPRNTSIGIITCRTLGLIATNSRSCP